MKTKFLLLAILVFLSLTSFSKSWTITNSGTTFTPATITINLGDSVNFSLSSMHNSVEVSQSTWDANGNTPLPGFLVPYGGGMVLPAQLTVGTHYYVCEPHAYLGMKGTIVVQNPVGITEILQKTDVTVYPNPSTGRFQLSISGSQLPGNSSLVVYNLLGDKVYQSEILTPIISVDLTSSAKGIYLFNIVDGQNIITKRVIKQ